MGGEGAGWYSAAPALAAHVLKRARCMPQLRRHARMHRLRQVSVALSPCPELPRPTRTHSCEGTHACGSMGCSLYASCRNGRATRPRGTVLFTAWAGWGDWRGRPLRRRCTLQACMYGCAGVQCGADERPAQWMYWHGAAVPGALEAPGRPRWCRRGRLRTQGATENRRGRRPASFGGHGQRRP